MVPSGLLKLEETILHARNARPDARRRNLPKPSGPPKTASSRLTSHKDEAPPKFSCGRLPSAANEPDVPLLVTG